MSPLRGFAQNLTQHTSRRAVLTLLAVLCGFGLASFGAFHKMPDPNFVPPGYIALVNRKGILISDFQTVTASVTGKQFEETTAAERRKSLEDMIDEELLVQRGVILDLPETTTEVRDSMTAAVNAQIDASTKGIVPTDEELRKFYEAHRDSYTTSGSMSVRDLVLKVGGFEAIDQSTAQAETDAGEAIYQLRSGIPIERVMQHFGLEDSGRADKGEALDFAAKLHLGADLYAAAARLGDGEISDPIPYADGVHVLVMEHRLAPRIADFNSVRAKVYSDYMEAASRAAQKEGLKILRKDAKIAYAPDAKP